MVFPEKKIVPMKKLTIFVDKKMMNYMKKVKICLIKQNLKKNFRLRRYNLGYP